MLILAIILPLAIIAPSTATSLTQALKPWEISKLTVGCNPCDLTGGNSWMEINTTITDPNAHLDFDTALPPSTAICTAKWPQYGAAPYSLVNTCTNRETSDKSLWRFEMLEPVEPWLEFTPTRHFVLRFTRKMEVDTPAGHSPHEVGVSVITFVGSARFASGVGGNMDGSIVGCGASLANMVCPSWLSEDKVPLYVNQTRVE